MFSDRRLGVESPDGGGGDQKKPSFDEIKVLKLLSNETIFPPLGGFFPGRKVGFEYTREEMKEAFRRHESKKESRKLRQQELVENPGKPFDELDNFSAHFIYLKKILGKLNAKSSVEEVNKITGEIREILRSLQQPELDDYLPEAVVDFFEHDGSAFRKEIYGHFILLLDELEKPTTEINFDLIAKCDESLHHNWEAYRLVMEDLLLRGESPSGVMEPDLDKERELGDLIDTLEWLMSGKYVKSSKEYVDQAGIRFVGISREDLIKLRITTPHSMIFNFFQNCLSNAVRKGIRATANSRVELVIKKLDGMLIFSFSDNGQGVDQEILPLVGSDEGVSTKSSETK